MWISKDNTVEDTAKKLRRYYYKETNLWTGRILSEYSVIWYRQRESKIDISRNQNVD